MKKIVIIGQLKIKFVFSFKSNLFLFRITVERKRSGLRLRIRNLTENDQGAWKCLGFDEYGKSISETFQINVKSIIFILKINLINLIFF